MMLLEVTGIDNDKHFIDINSIESIDKCDDHAVIYFRSTAHFENDYSHINVVEDYESIRYKLMLASML